MFPSIVENTLDAWLMRIENRKLQLVTAFEIIIIQKRSLILLRFTQLNVSANLIKLYLSLIASSGKYPEKSLLARSPVKYYLPTSYS